MVTRCHRFPARCNDDDTVLLFIRTRKATIASYGVDNIPAFEVPLSGSG